MLHILPLGQFIEHLLGHFLAHGFLFGVMAPDTLFDFLDRRHEVHFNVIKVALIHWLSPKADVLCGFGCFRGLDLCAQQGAQCREHGILCCDAGRKGVIKILRYAVSKLCKAGVFQQQVDYLCIDAPCVEVLCGFYGQAKFSNVVVLAVGDVGFSQQKIRGHVEQPCNPQHLLMGQGSFRTADEAADGALGAADLLGKLWLADVVFFHQVRKTDVGWCGQIFLCHVVGPPF